MRRRASTDIRLIDDNQFCFFLALPKSISADWHAAMSVSVLFDFFFHIRVIDSKHHTASTKNLLMSIILLLLMQTYLSKHTEKKTRRRTKHDTANESRLSCTIRRHLERESEKKNEHVKLRPVNICHRYIRCALALALCHKHFYVLDSSVDPLAESVDLHLLLRDTNYYTCKIAQTHLYFASKCCYFVVVCVSGCVSCSRSDHAYLNARQRGHIFHFSIADMHLGAANTVGARVFFEICHIFRPSPSFDHNSFIHIHLFHKGPIRRRLRKCGGHWLWFHWVSSYMYCLEIALIALCGRKFERKLGRQIARNRWNVQVPQLLDQESTAWWRFLL